jgi:hypothetical protein
VLPPFFIPACREVAVKLKRALRGAPSGALFKKASSISPKNGVNN